MMVDSEVLKLLDQIPKRPIDPEDLPERTRLCGGAYELEHVLGRGGMATVYLARDAVAGARVALKILSSDKSQSDYERRRFENEARIGEILGTHPNLVAPFRHDIAADLNDRPVIAMEYVAGPLLASLVRCDPLEPLYACRLILDIARGLEFMHRQSVVHRDVKPSNIIVDKSLDQARLLDFGYAFVRREADLPGASRLTRVDERPGTKVYMSPQQAMGHLPAVTDDIYALAITLYEALSGHTPCHGLEPADVVRRKCNEGLPSFSIASESVDLPESLVRLVDDGLKLRLRERVPSMALFRKRLEGIVAELEGHLPTDVAQGQATEQQDPPRAIASSVQESQTLPDPVVRTRPWRLLAAVVASGVVVLLGFWATAAGRAGNSTPVEGPTSKQAGVVETNTPPVQRVDVGPFEHPVRVIAEPIEPPMPASSSSSDDSVVPGERLPPGPPERENKRRQERLQQEAKTARPPLPSKPGAESVDCAKVRAAAEAAALSKAWRKVLRMTKSKGCWPAGGAGERLRLRTLAYYKTGQYAKCAKSASRTTNDEAKRFSQACTRRLAQEAK